MPEEKKNIRSYKGSDVYMNYFLVKIKDADKSRRGKGKERGVNS